MTKENLRNLIKSKRKSMDANLKLDMDKRIFNYVITSPLYINANMIFIFVSFRNEVDTHRIIEYALHDGKSICVPKVIRDGDKKYMTALQIKSLNDLKPGYFGVPEPCFKTQPIEGGEIDLIFMPGLAFDRTGGRIGYGAGFYDRFLTLLDKCIPKIALAYHYQVFDSIPTDAYDIKVDGIITDQETFMLK